MTTVTEDPSSLGAEAQQDDKQPTGHDVQMEAGRQEIDIQQDIEKAMLDEHETQQVKSIEEDRDPQQEVIGESKMVDHKTQQEDIEEKITEDREPQEKVIDESEIEDRKPQQEGIEERIVDDREAKQEGMEEGIIEEHEALEEDRNDEEAEQEGGTDREDGHSIHHVDFFSNGEHLSPCTVEFVSDDAVKVDEHLITLDRLRYATQRQYKGFPQRPSHCILLSFIDQTSSIVKHCFIEKSSVQETTKLGEEFSNLVKRKFLTGAVDNVDEDCYEAANEQPLHFGGANVKVMETAEKGTIYEGRSVIVLDIECLAIYPVIKEDLGEPHRLMFWKEEGPNSVDRILHHSKAEKLVFETPKCTYEMPALSEVVRQLNELRPKTKNVLAERRLLREWVMNITRSKKFVSSASSSLYPEIYEEHAAGVSRLPARELATEGASNLQAWAYGEGLTAQYQRQDVNKSVMQEFNAELDTAVNELEKDEYMQMCWISVEADINETIDSGKVPETDHYSGGLDPDDPEHLKKALNDVVDQLKGQEYGVAVSRLHAARRIFQTSKSTEISNFFQAKDMDLLKKLYFKSLVQ